MSITSKMQAARSTPQQPASNILGTMGASALAGGATPTPTTTAGAMGADPGPAGGITLVQAVLGVIIIWAVWWAVTWVLEKLVPLRDTPHFLVDWLHGFKYALLVAGWFLVWKMTGGVQPLASTPYGTVAAAI